MSIREGGRVGGAVAGTGGALSCWSQPHVEPPEIMLNVKVVQR